MVNVIAKNALNRYNFLVMKKGVHPDNYRLVVFQDINDGTTFLTRSTAASEDTLTLEGVDYPLIKVHISSSSHPFYTGQEKLVDIEGRVDKFKARRQAGQSALEAKKAKIASSSGTKKVKKKSEKSQPAAEEVPATTSATPEEIPQATDK